MKYFKINTFKEYSIFFWLTLITILGVCVLYIYTDNKSNQIHQIKTSLENIYLKKVLKEITSNLEPRFTKKNYTSKAGDTYEDIIYNLNIGKNEKELLLNTILDEKSLKVLKINQKFRFKFDNLKDQKVKEFIIEIDKKNEIRFTKLHDRNEFIKKKIKAIN